jgi:hypothetical protein
VKLITNRISVFVHNLKMLSFYTSPADDIGIRTEFVQCASTVTFTGGTRTTGGTRKIVWWYATILNYYLFYNSIFKMLWDFKFSRRRVWCSKLSSGIYCRVKLLSTDVSEVNTASSGMMEAVRTSETSVDNHFTRQYIPEDSSQLNTTQLDPLFPAQLNWRYVTQNQTLNVHTG